MPRCIWIVLYVCIFNVLKYDRLVCCCLRLHFVHKLFFWFLNEIFGKFDIKLQLNKTEPCHTIHTLLDFFKCSLWYIKRNTIEILIFRILNSLLKINSLKLFWNDVCTLYLKNEEREKNASAFVFKHFTIEHPFGNGRVIKSHWSQSKKKQSNDSWRYTRATIATNDRNQPTNGWKRRKNDEIVPRNIFCCILTYLHAN